MASKYKKLTINTILFAIGTLGSKVIGFLFVPLYTNVLSTAEYGIADLIITLSSLLLPLFSLSMGESILFYGLKANNNDERERLFKNGFTVVLVGSIFLGFISPLFLFYHSLGKYVFFLPIYAVLEILRNYFKYYTKAREKNLIFTIHNIVYSLVFVLLNIIFLLVIRIGLYGYLLSLVISETTSLIILIIYNKGFSTFFRYRIDRSTIKTMVVYSAPLILDTIAWTVSSTSDRFMLDFMVSTDSVGIYSAASRIPTVINTFANLFCSAWTISAYLEKDDFDKRFFANTFAAFSVFLIILSSTILFISRPFMFVYVGESFRDAANYVPILLISSVFQSFSAFFSSIIQSKKKNVFMLISTLVATAFNLILNYILITFFHIYGACIATALSFLIVFFLRFVFSRKIAKFPIDIVRLVLSFIVLIIQVVLITINFKIVFTSLLCFTLLIVFNHKSLLFLIRTFFKKFFTKKNA